MTAILKPLKNGEDNMLSLASQTILLFAFCCCAVIRVANARNITNDQRQAILGFKSAEGVFLALAFCFIAFLVLILGSYV